MGIIPTKATEMNNSLNYCEKRFTEAAMFQTDI